uniref:Surfeit locus protein 2 n=1 Tax=Strongyloides stercoralis TaxID=6248 RepID=A0A0K0DYA0_STRER
MNLLTKDDLLQAYPYFTLTDMGRLKCSLTGHEIIDNLKHLQDYIGTRKFKRALEIDQIKKEFGQYIGTIENTDRLYCKVTMRDIESDPVSLKKHFEGKRFKKRLPIYLEKLEKGELLYENDTDSEGSSYGEDISFDERRKLCAIVSASESDEEKSVDNIKGKLTKMDVFEDIIDQEDEETDDTDEQEINTKKVKLQKRKKKANGFKKGNKKIKKN